MNELVQITYKRLSKGIHTAIIKRTQLVDICKLSNLKVLKILEAPKNDKRDYILK